MLNDFLSSLIFFWSTYVTSYEGIATMLVIAIMLLKFLINQKASSLKFKKMLVSVPGELVVLVLGFLLADMINDNRAGTSDNSQMASIVIALIILIIEYALERWLDDKLSGSVEKKIWVICGLMYLVSIGFYVCTVFGGVHNGR